MTLKVDAERWCESVVAPGSVRNRPVRCGHAAIFIVRRLRHPHVRVPRNCVQAVSGRDLSKL